MKRHRRGLLSSALFFGLICRALLLPSTGLCQSCDGASTTHSIYNLRVWEGTGMGCSDDTSDIANGPEYWGSQVKRTYETDLDDEPAITLSGLLDDTDGDRVLVMISHGLVGYFVVEEYATRPARDSAYAYYCSTGTYDCDASGDGEVDIDYVDGLPGYVDVFLIYLRVWGIKNLLRSGHFASEAIVHGNYCESGLGWEGGWKGGDITSFTGYEDCPTGAVACEDIAEIQDRMCCNKLINLGEDIEAAVRGDGVSARAYGDSANRYDCTQKCPTIPIAARVERFRVEGGMARWRVTYEKDTRAYRLLGIGESVGEEALILSEGIPARGPGSDYEVSVTGEWRRLKLQEEARIPGGRYVWRDMGIAEAREELGAPPPAEVRGRGRRELHVIGLTSDSTGVRQYVQRKRSTGLKASYDLVTEITRPLVEQVQTANAVGGPLNIIWSRRGGETLGVGKSAEAATWNGPVRIVGPQSLSGPLEAYQAELEDELGVTVSLYLVDPPVDTATVRAFLVPLHGTTAILFGEAFAHDATSTTMPLYYLEDPTPDSAFGWYSSKLMSLCGYEHVTFPFPVGFIPTKDTTEAWDYFFKRVDVGWNETWYDYGRRLGTWGFDIDNGDCPGEDIRAQMESALESAHPDWQLAALWASEAGGWQARAESLVAALSAGRSIVAMLSTGGTDYDYGNWLYMGSWWGADPDGALSYTGKYTHLLSLSCMTNAVDHLRNACPSEKLLHIPGGAAISSIGPSRGFNSWYYYAYLRQFLDVQRTYAFEFIGKLHSMTKYELLSLYPDDPMMDLFCKTMVLIGDPTVQVVSPRNPMYAGVEGGGGGERGGLTEKVVVRPTPSNPECAVTFHLGGERIVVVDVFDVSGRRVKRLLDGRRGAGDQTIVWNGRSGDGKKVSSGVYFVRVTVGREVGTARAVVVR